MTNISEKSLLIGFGIFTIIIFLSFIAPFITSFIEFNTNENSDIQKYISFMDEVDKGINYVIQNPNNNFIQTIEYPKKFNMSFINNMAKFYFFIENMSQTRIIEYSSYFVSKKFENINPTFYVLNISIKLSNIIVNLI